MFKKIIYMFALVFFTVSCADVKRGITGSKKQSTDEFLVIKKDPLILPPDYENLPVPDETVTTSEEISIFENTLETSTEGNSSTSNSIESSILKKIQSK
tara:strand:+ start:1625 stop:1921 length:297 start_codon:yes stop_codon:yes gene_type:complete